MTVSGILGKSTQVVENRTPEAISLNFAILILTFTLEASSMLLHVFPLDVLTPMSWRSSVTSSKTPVEFVQVVIAVLANSPSQYCATYEKLPGSGAGHRHDDPSVLLRGQEQLKDRIGWIPCHVA